MDKRLDLEQPRSQSEAPGKRRPARGRRADQDLLALSPEPRLEVLRTIGVGGAGKVEAVFDHRLRRMAARKSLLDRHATTPARRRQLVREARITSQLDHPNIVPVYDLDSDHSGQLHFSMKLVEGRTLAKMIDGWRDLGIEEGALLDVLDALIKVCDALSLAHSRSVVHCDIKPENIMLGDYGEVYLMDWGSAVVLEEGRSDPTPSWLRQLGYTRPSLPGDAPDNTIAGTPNYMAPEQANGERALIGPRTDVFGVGATLYEVLTGRQPYDDIDEYLAIEFAAKCCYTPLKELIEAEFIPPLLERVINRCMAADPSERYGSIEQLKADLVRYTRGGREFPVLRFAPGTVVVSQGDRGDCAYIISRGYCDVVKTVEGHSMHLRRLGPGEVFGETALLSPGPRTANVIAVDEVSAQVVHRDVLTHELDDTRPWLSKLVRTVAERFRELDARPVPTASTPDQARLARHATMYLHTWGEPQADGSLLAPWSTLDRTLGTDHGLEPGALYAALSAYDAFVIDTERDRILLMTPRAFAACIKHD